MANNSNSQGCQLPSIGIVLTLIFVVLKLTDNIDWSWWVLSPLWISFIFYIAILILVVIIGVIFLKFSDKIKVKIKDVKK